MVKITVYQRETESVFEDAFASEVNAQGVLVIITREGTVYGFPLTSLDHYTVEGMPMSTDTEDADVE
jgi:hypothetical protein